MKILYIAPTIEHYKHATHKTELILLESLIAHPAFDVLHSPQMTVKPGLRQRNSEPIYNTDGYDVVLHHNLSKHIWVSLELEDATLLVHDYIPIKDDIDKYIDKGIFSSFITVPLVATEHLSNCQWLGHYIPEFFDDYGEDKTIDVLSYGQIGGKYPFRKRLVDLLSDRSDIYFVRGTWYGEELARTINASHLVISDTSIDNYMVKKYLEVPACKSTVLGDVNEECRKVFPNNEGILEASPDDSDDIIIDKIYKFLENPKPSEKAYEIARSRNPKAYAEELYRICLEEYRRRCNASR